MWLFNSWIYQNILNTEWFMWGIVITVFGFNFLSPIIVFFALSEKKLHLNFKKWIKDLKNKSQTTGS